MSASAPRLAVVIPTLDEESHLPALLDDLVGLGVSCEVVVSDGGSTDRTRAWAKRAGARVLYGPRGRAAQLRAGVEATRAPWLLFLHADTRLPAAARDALRAFLDRATETDFAHFRFALRGDGWFWRFIELGQWIRERAYGLVYGDQGLLVSREFYYVVGGFPEWPFLEDVGMVDRLRRQGRRTRLPAPLPASPRRYDSDGRWSGWLRNAALISLFRLGVPAHRLARWYPAREGGGPVAPRRAIIVFAKAPRPGQVKTRLAAEVGDSEAVRIYRTLGRRVVDRLRGGPDRLVVFHDPPDGGARHEIAEWLGNDGIELAPQVGGDLGARMAAAFGTCFSEADEVCIVGTDVPGLDRDTVQEAFERLGACDVVLGPAQDGGYYLLALRAPQPELFDDMPWSTDVVLSLTLERCRAEALTVELLGTKADVDTREDVPQELANA